MLIHLHAIWKESDNLGKHHDDCQCQQHERKERQSGLCDDKNVATRQGLKHEQVKTNRWRNLGHLNDNDDENAEPKRVDTGLLYQKGGVGIDHRLV